MGHATAEDFHKNISKCKSPPLQDVNVESDDPNVNKKTFRLINDEVKSVRKLGSIEIGF